MKQKNAEMTVTEARLCAMKLRELAAVLESGADYMESPDRKVNRWVTVVTRQFRPWGHVAISRAFSVPEPGTQTDQMGGSPTVHPDRMGRSTADHPDRIAR